LSILCRLRKLETENTAKAARVQLLEEQLAETQSKLAAEVEIAANAAKAQRQELLQM
jgi:hypothetical protein